MERGAAAAAPGAARFAPERWRVIVDRPRSGAANMALDHALALHVRPGEGAVRLYEWSRPTISFGRHEPARGLYDLEKAARSGIGFVRRPTGGRAVLHDAELTYAVVASPKGWGGLRRSYRRVNGGLLFALRQVGARADLAAAPTECARPSEGPCFGRAAEGEVVVGGRKLLGSAQAKIGSMFLQHGSLILRGGQRRLAVLRGAGRRLDTSPAPSARPSGEGALSLRSALGALPPLPELRQAMIDGLLASLGGEPRRADFTPRERSEAERLAARYRSPDWTWRR